MSRCAEGSAAAHAVTAAALAKVTKAHDETASQLFEIEEAREQGRMAESGESDALAGLALFTSFCGQNTR